MFMPFSFPKNIPLSCNRSLFPKKNFIFRHSFKFISTKLATPYPLPYLNIPHSKPPTYKISDSTREGTSSVCIGGGRFAITYNKRNYLCCAKFTGTAIQHGCWHLAEIRIDFIKLVIEKMKKYAITNLLK